MVEYGRAGSGSRVGPVNDLLSDPRELADGAVVECEADGVWLPDSILA